MIDRKALKRIAKTVAAEMSAGRISTDVRLALQPLEVQPGHVLDVVALLESEGLKKRPNEGLISAYTFILGHSLELLRYAVERKNAAAVDIVDRLRELLLESARQERISPAMLMLIMQLFVSGKLDAGDALRDQLSQLMVRDGEADADAGRGDGHDHFALIAAETENDPFAIHAYLNQSIESLPKGMRAGLVMAVLAQDIPAVREASLGFLLCRAEDARNKLLELLTLAAPHGLVSSTMLRRMIAIRNWLPEAGRADLDGAIEAARANSAVCAPSDNAEVVKVVASGIDGSGAITVLVIVRTGRKHALGGVLSKQGFGIRDAWVRRGLSKAELNEILDDIGSELAVAPSNLDYLTVILRQGLATNLKTGNPPPFGTLDLVETCGLAEIIPALMPVEAQVADILEGIDPALLSASAIEKALRDSRDLEHAHPILESWFEDNVNKLIGGKRAPRAKQIALLLAGPLHARRRRWAELCASMALSLKHQNHDGWQSFAIVARELLGTRPLDEIGLMTAIAEATLDVIGMQALYGIDWAA